MGQTVYLTTGLKSATGTDDVDRPPGAHKAAAFLIGYIATGTWDIDVQIVIGTQALTVATLQVTTGNGVEVIALQTPFDTQPAAIPEVNRILFTRTGGALVFEVRALYA